MRKLVRSSGLVDNRGNYTAKFNWTEIITVFGVAIRCFQLKNLGYEEILEMYPQYFPPGKYPEINSTKYWYKAVIYK